MAPHTETWSFEREGYFAVERHDPSIAGATPAVDAMITADAIHLMYTPSWAKTPVDVMLTRNKKGEYEGLDSVSTFACGPSAVKFKASKSN